jgi:arginine exporter protein ArgO
VFVGITAVNPTTVVYFAAVVLGNSHLVDGSVQGLVFVTAAFVASASWQLGLAVAGTGLGRSVTGPRGRLVTGLVSALVVAGLAVRTILG